MFVLEAEGMLVGSAVINQVQVAQYSSAPWRFQVPDSGVCVLHTLVISPSHSAKGYGREFVRFYEQYAARNGLFELRIDTNAKNTAAREMYRRYGYEEVAVVPTVFNGIPNVELVMLEKNLEHAGQKQRAQAEEK